MTDKHEKKIEGMKRNLEDKTGRSLEGWIELLNEEGPSESAERLSWLKEQGLGHFQAKLVISEAATE